MVVFSLLRNSLLFSIAVAWFYFPAKSVPGFQFLRILNSSGVGFVAAAAAFFIFLIIAILTSVRWYLRCGFYLHFISDVETLFRYLLILYLVSLNSYVPWGVIYNSQEVETIIYRCLEKGNGVYTYNEILFGFKTEGNPIICNIMDGPWGYYVK